MKFMWNLPKRKEIKKEFETIISLAEGELKDQLLRAGIRVIPQFPIKNYIVDFALPEYLLVIEYDGKVHLNQPVYDFKRHKELEKLGWKILRIMNKGEIFKYQIMFDWKVIYNGLTQEGAFKVAIETVKDYIKEADQSKKGFIEKYSVEILDENGKEIIIPRWKNLKEILKEKNHAGQFNN